MFLIIFYTLKGIITDILYPKGVFYMSLSIILYPIGVIYDRYGSKVDPLSPWNIAMSYVRAETREQGDGTIRYVFDLSGTVRRADDIAVAKRIILRRWRTEEPLSPRNATGYFDISFKVGSLLLLRKLNVVGSGRDVRMETGEDVTDPCGMLEGSQVGDQVSIQGPLHSNEFQGHLISALQLVSERDPSVPPFIYSGELAVG